MCKLLFYASLHSLYFYVLVYYILSIDFEAVPFCDFDDTVVHLGEVTFFFVFLNAWAVVVELWNDFEFVDLSSLICVFWFFFTLLKSNFWQYCMAECSFWNRLQIYAATMAMWAERILTFPCTKDGCIGFGSSWSLCSSTMDQRRRAAHSHAGNRFTMNIPPSRWSRANVEIVDWFIQS